jgi:cell division septum initiation protein DivIVA
MIDFRYHLVSIVAVFLALAVGIVVGTAALNGPVLDGLRSDVDALTEDNRALEDQAEDLQTQLDASDAAAAQIAPQLVGGALDEQRVLLVTTPGAPRELAESLVPVLASAGAAVTGQLDVRGALGDPQSRALVEDLVAQVLPAQVQLPDGSPVERAGAVLASALSTGPDATEVEEEEAQAVVSAFQEADLVSFDSAAADDALTRATLVVVLSGPGSGAGPTVEQAQQLEAMLAVAQALDDRSEGVVVAGAGDAAQPGGLLAALRAQSTTAQDVSSVDGADRGLGRVTLVSALAEQRAGRAGQYGAGPGATAVLPEPAATPAAEPAGD